MEETASINDIVAHKYIDNRGHRIHYVEMGSGPTVLLLHGFPDFWYSYRYQIPFLAAAGFHVVVPDLRGFGESGVPESADKYTSLHQTGDMITLLNALRVDKAFVVGHDWGSLYASDLCLMRPDRVKGVVYLSVPYMPLDPANSLFKRTTDRWGEESYIAIFQKPGQAEALFAKSTPANILKGFFLRWHLSSENLCMPPFFTDEDDEPLPEWFNEKDVKFYAETFDKTGFTGGFNHYRASELNQELRIPWAFAEIHTPALTVMGETDFVYPTIVNYAKSEMLNKYLKNLGKSVVLDAGHFMHQEKHEETNALLLEFFQLHKE